MGLEAVGLFLSFNSGGIFFARVVGGRISDRYGRAVTGYPGLLVAAIMALLAIPVFAALRRERAGVA